MRRRALLTAALLGGYLLDRGAVAVAGPTDRLRRDPGVQAAWLGAPPTR